MWKKSWTTDTLENNSNKGKQVNTLLLEHRTAEVGRHESRKAEQRGSGHSSASPEAKPGTGHGGERRAAGPGVAAPLPCGARRGAGTAIRGAHGGHAEGTLRGPAGSRHRLPHAAPTVA